LAPDAPGSFQTVFLSNPAQLPPSYLAEVLAHAQLGEPEAGFETSPGLLYLASELYRQARGRLPHCFLAARA
jgi:hypothetical protein